LKNYLIIGDLQIPYQHQKALEFCRYLKKHYKIADDCIYNVGDETDCYWGSLYPKNPNSIHTAKTELEAARDILKQWYSAFPKVKLAYSNHGLRWVKKATHAEIPSEMLREYREILRAPMGWQWAEQWIVHDKHGFKVVHGHRYSGLSATRNMLIDSAMSVAHGHYHSGAQTVWLNTHDKGLMWACNVGSLIDVEQVAFDYEKKNRFKPILSSAVILDHGRVPIIHPLCY
jgi:hypothetical protein